MDNNSTKKFVLIAATLASFLTPFIGSSINIALPSIGKEFNIDVVLLSWITTSYILSAAVFLVPFGRIADIYGRKKIFLYGIFIFTLSSLLCAVSNSAFTLIYSRILQGIGSSMIYSTGVAILTSVFPVGKRGKVLGINVAATYLGLSLGPFLGGFLTQYLGWRSIFLSILPVGLVIIIFTFWKLKGEWAEAEGEKFDFIGFSIYGIALSTLIYGFSLLPGKAGIVLILIGVSGILLFVKWEMETESPVLNMYLFKNNITFTFSNLAALINYSATFAVSFLLSLYLQYIKNFNPKTAGLILVSQPAVQALFSPFAGKLSDRIEPRIVASLGMALTTMGLFLLIFLNERSTLGFLIASLFILGFGFALFSSPNTNAIMSSVDKKFYGIASGTLGTMRLMGQSLSMGIAMLIFAIFIGRTQIIPEHHYLFLKSTKINFLIFSSLCFIGIFASIARGKVR